MTDPGSGERDGRRRPAAPKAPAPKKGLAPKKGPAPKTGATARPATAKKPAAGTKSAAGKKGSAKKPAARPPRPPKLTPEELAAAWRAELDAKRPGLVAFVLDGLVEMYGRPAWDRRNDPTSELVLTILSQNSADVNAEAGFESLRAAFPSVPVSEEDRGAAPFRPAPGWGGKGLPELPPPDWDAVESAPIERLIEAIRPAGLAYQKSPRIQAALRAIRERAGSHSLEFLADLPALEAREWMTRIDGIGPKTASVVLLFSFGTPLMPVDRHVERVSQRVGLIPAKATADQAHDMFLAMLEPDQMYEAHVGLIRHGRETCHARNPECTRCALASRCRYVSPDAP